MRNRILVGAGVRCLINSVDIGIVTAIQWGTQTAKEEERGIDSMAPFELSGTSSSVSGSVSVYRMRDSGGLEGLNIVKPIPEISEDEYFTLELKDRLTGSTYFKVDHAACDGQSWSASAKGIVTGQFSFHGLSAKHSFQG
jgi:hypothetical protein